MPNMCLEEPPHSAHKAPEVVVSLVQFFQAGTQALQLWTAPGHCTKRGLTSDNQARRQGQNNIQQIAFAYKSCQAEHD